MSKNNANKFSPEVRESAVRLVQASRSGYPSLWVAVESIAPNIGCLAQTLLTWVKRHEGDSGQREGVSTSERMKELERENREQRRANDILRTASAFFAQAELDRKLKSQTPTSTGTRRSTGSSRSARCCRLPRRPIGATPRGYANRLGAAIVPGVTNI